MEHIGVDERIQLKCILKKYFERAWARLFWFRRGTSGEDVVHTVSVSTRKVRAIITAAEKPLTSPEGLRTLGLVIAMIHTHTLSKTQHEKFHITFSNM